MRRRNMAGYVSWPYDFYGPPALLPYNKLRKMRLHEARTKGTHTPREWTALVASATGMCPRCEMPCVRPEKDHIVRIIDGGSDAIENLQPLCRACNRGKRDAIDWLAVRGLR